MQVKDTVSKRLLSNGKKRRFVAEVKGLKAKAAGVCSSGFQTTVKGGGSHERPMHFHFAVTRRRRQGFDASMRPPSGLEMLSALQGAGAQAFLPACN